MRLHEKYVGIYRRITRGGSALLKNQFARGKEIKEHTGHAASHQAECGIVIDERDGADQKRIGATVEDDPDGTDGGKLAPLFGHGFVINFTKSEQAVTDPCEGDGEGERKETSRNAIHPQSFNPDVKKDCIDGKAYKPDEPELEKLDESWMPKKLKNLVDETVRFQHVHVPL